MARQPKAKVTIWLESLNTMAFAAEEATKAFTALAEHVKNDDVVFRSPEANHAYNDVALGVRAVELARFDLLTDDCPEPESDKVGRAKATLRHRLAWDRTRRRVREALELPDPGEG
jgi:hypothetical protein